MGADAPHRHAQCFQKFVVAGLASQRQVEVVAQSLAFAALVCMAPEKGVEPYRIGMERDGKHVSARIEYALGAVAMMQVHVEDGDAIRLSAQRLCRHSRIVDEAETAGDVGKGMMAGRAAKRI